MRAEAFPLKTIQSHAVIDQDQVIRPPDGVVLPHGEVEVSVRETAHKPSEDPLASMRAWLLDLSADAVQAAPDLPEELAQQHDHYAHGKPRT